MTRQNKTDLQDRPTHQVSITRYRLDSAEQLDDLVAIEEPLEIRVAFGPPEKRRSKSLSITMRTPGHDVELATGFLLSENVIQSANQIDSIEHVGPAPENGQHGNTLMVDLAPGVQFAPEKLQRHFYMTSSCGVCGKASIDAVLEQGFEPVPQTITVESQLISELPTRLREQQAVFDVTGGLHAAGLFNQTGELITLREDVGRHNAVDKLVGQQMYTDISSFPQAGRVLLVSGRASFELVQKALTASFELLVAVGAPSSLAVQLATEFDLTLIGFASKQKFNVYSGFERVRLRDTKSS